MLRKISRNSRFIFLLNFLCLIYFILNLPRVLALQIVEVNHSASNNNDRWIKILNDGNNISDFTISDFKTLDHKATTTKHSISVLLGEKNFPTNSYVYISPSNNLPVGANKVFKSNFDLDKNNGYIQLINSDNSGIYTCFQYGNGLCPNNSNFISYNPPTDSNLNINSSSTTSSTSTSSSVSTSSVVANLNSDTNIVYVYVNNPDQNNLRNKYGDILVLLPEVREVPAMAAVDYTVKVIDSSKKVVSSLNFIWSFGDGGERFGQDVIYHYNYPGEYTLIVQADNYSGRGEAKMKVKVYQPEISILKVSTSSQENWVELKNHTNYDVYLSNFYLRINEQDFKLPTNFVIAKNQSVKVAGQALGFTMPAMKFALLYPNKNILSEYKYLIATTTLINPANTIISTISTSTFSQITKEQSTPLANLEIKNNLDLSKTLLEHKLSEKSELAFLEKKDILENFANLNRNTDFATTSINNLNNNLENQSVVIENAIQDSTSSKSVDINIIKWLRSLLYYVYDIW